MKLKPRTFVAQVDRVFAKPLAAFGFEPDGEDHQDDWYACRRFRRGEHFIEITASCHVRDGRPECGVILGEGSYGWPECDWNAIALWRLNGAEGNYPFTNVRKVPSILAGMLTELNRDAKDFLRGDLERFHEKLAAQAAERQPYKIHYPSRDGVRRNPELEKLIKHINRINQKLFKKYSRRKKT